MAGYSSNSKMFAKRGNPWVSQKEGIKDFGRNPETENAEYDFDHRYHTSGQGFGKPTVAPPHVEIRSPKRLEAREKSFQERKTSILRGMNQRLHGRLSIKVADAPPAKFRPCDGCRLAACITARNGLGACQFPMGRK